MLLLSTLAPPPSPTGASQEELQKLLTLDHTDQVTIKREETENTNGNGPFQMRAAFSESETDDDDYMDVNWMRRHAASSEHLDDTGLDEENDPMIKQEDCDAEHDVQHASSEEEEDVEIKLEDTDDHWYTKRDLLEKNFERDALNA